MNILCRMAPSKTFERKRHEEKFRTISMIKILNLNPLLKTVFAITSITDESDNYQSYMNEGNCIMQM